MTLEKIHALEAQIESTLYEVERQERLGEALAAYEAIERELERLEFSPVAPEQRERERVLAYCLMRQENILRQLGRVDEALQVGKRQLAAVRKAGDLIQLARTLLSTGSTDLLAGRTEDGLHSLQEARRLFESGDSFDHKQGLGWYWILQADLIAAGLLSGDQTQIIAAADRALALLTPIENWPGVARAYQARAKAHAALGEDQAAAEDRRQAAYYEEKS